MTVLRDDFTGPNNRLSGLNNLFSGLYKPCSALHKGFSGLYKSCSSLQKTFSSPRNGRSRPITQPPPRPAFTPCQLVPVSALLPPSCPRAFVVQSSHRRDGRRPLVLAHA